MDIGFEKIILCNIAQHPQYTGLILCNKKYNPYLTLDLRGYPDFYKDYILTQEKEFLKHKYLAVEIGCSPANLNLFLLADIRCANSLLSIKQPKDEFVL